MLRRNRPDSQWANGRSPCCRHASAFPASRDTETMRRAMTVSCRHPYYDPPSKSARRARARFFMASLRLCLFRGRVGNGKRPRSVKLLELSFALRQAVRHRPQRGRIDAEPDMACEIDLDVFGGIG